MNVMTKKIGEFYRGLLTLELKRRLDASSDVFLLNYHKLKSSEMTQLRKDLKNIGVSILVTKNSFMRKIFEETKKPAGALSLIDGPMAFVFVEHDPIAASRVITHFAKEHEALVLRGGFLSDRVLTPADIKLISKLISRQALYQQVASTLNAPMGKLAMSLNQVLAKLAYALKALSNKKK
jgi:large subunit ribosomal protein L10